MRWLWQPTRLVLILAAVATAAVPPLRQEFVWNARALVEAIPRWRQSDYVACLDGYGNTPGAVRIDPAALLRARPRDLQLRIALASGDGLRQQTPIEQQALAEALRVAPRDPVVLSLVALRPVQVHGLDFSREESLGGRRAERRERRASLGSPPISGAQAPAAALPPGEYAETLLAPRQVAASLNDLDAWAAADPDNAAPDVFAAYLLLGAKQDPEALARAERASRKRSLTLYDLPVMRAQAHGARLSGAPPGGAQLAALGYSSYIMPLARFRSFARIMQAIGWDRFDAGDREIAFRYWLTTARIGKLMAHQERETTNTELVGVATMATGYAPIYRFTRPPEAEEKYAGGDFLPNDAYASFVAARGKQAADAIYADLAWGQRLRDHVREALEAAGVFTGAQRYLVATTTVMIALPAILLTLAFCIVALPLGRRCPPALSRRWSAILVAVAIVVPLGLAVARDAARVFGASDWEAPTWGSAIPFLPGSIIPLVMPPALLVLAAIAAIWPARKQRLGYRAALGGALRQTLPTALAVLAVIWVGAAAVAAREGAVYVKHMNRMYQVGELRMLQEIVSSEK